MSTRLRLYVCLITLAAVLVVISDPAAWTNYASGWNLVLVLGLVALAAAAEHVSFQVQSGWTTHAGTVPHLAAALLLPPSLAALVAGLGMAIYVYRRRPPLTKAIFNTAKAVLAVGAASLVVAPFGGPAVLSEVGSWHSLLAAALASAAYYVVSDLTIALVVALDQRRPFLQVMRGNLGMKTLTEIGLGLLGATLAVLLTAAPGFAPTLVVPAVLMFLAKRVLDRAAHQARDLALTNTVGQAVAGSLNLDVAFDAITAREVRDALTLDGLALLPLLDTPDFEARVAADIDQPTLRAKLAARIAAAPVRVSLHGSDQIPREWIDVLDADRFMAATALPCGVGGSAPTCALVAWRSTTSNEGFEGDELLLLETLADYAAVALETTRLFHAAVRGRADAEQREARIRAVMDNVADGLLTFDEMGIVDSCNPAAERIFGTSAAVLTGQSIVRWLPTASAEASQHHDVDGYRLDGTSLPVELAITEVQHSDAHRFIAVVRDIGERKAFEEQLRHMAFHDHLTGLPNRALFMDRVEHALARADSQGRSIAVLFVDLDNFKVVNDSLGHAAGDRLLSLLTARLRACLDPHATLARFGGDEFTILLEDVDVVRGLDDANAAAKRIRDDLRRPIGIAEQEVFATASIGIAISSPGHDTPGDLVRNADVAMYRAKANGRACAVVFDQGLDSLAVGRLELETELRRAVDQHELVVYYQPIVELPTGRIQDMEALVRWQHPQHGLIAPDRFIPLAEETGLIIPLGMWVLETACRQLRAWDTLGGLDAGLSMSVNLSARQFQHPTLVEDIARVLRASRLDPRRLMLEVTESIAMRDAASAASILAELKGLGVRLAIDDFGTGYSSLSYLHRFPIDVLKIDRSFVARLGGERNDAAIVEAVIALARGLNMEVTAEGIETSDQRARLEALGCDRGQGYLFARPLPAAGATDLLRRQLGSAKNWSAAAA
jgi:diguanylate cyclase (GGDEF)-like protein/PAS domain S-box-containing protein